jgi:hypothetical protein
MLSSQKFPKHRHNQAHHRLGTVEELTHAPLVYSAVMAQSRSLRHRITATALPANTQASLSYLALTASLTTLCHMIWKNPGKSWNGASVLTGRRFCLASGKRKSSIMIGWLRAKWTECVRPVGHRPMWGVHEA